MSEPMMYRATWPVLPDAFDWHLAELRVEALAELRDMLHADRVQLLSPPEFRIDVTGAQPVLVAEAPAEPWTDGGRLSQVRAFHGPADGRGVAAW